MPCLCHGTTNRKTDLRSGVGVSTGNVAEPPSVFSSPRGFFSGRRTSFCSGRPSPAGLQCSFHSTSSVLPFATGVRTRKPNSYPTPRSATRSVKRFVGRGRAFGPVRAPRRGSGCPPLFSMHQRHTPRRGSPSGGRESTITRTACSKRPVPVVAIFPGEWCFFPRPGTGSSIGPEIGNRGSGSSQGLPDKNRPLPGEFLRIPMFLRA